MIPTRAPWRRHLTTATIIFITLSGILSGCGTHDGSGTPPGGTGTAAPPTSGEGILGPAAESSTAKYGVMLDVVEQPGGVLRTTEGRTYQLGAGVGYVVRVPAGWLYGPTDRSGPVTLLRADATVVSLPAVIERNGGDVPALPAMSADGQRIAWAKGSTVIAGKLTPAGITDEVSTPAPADTYPLTWAGAMVVLGQPYGPGCCGYRKLQYDVWDPTRGNFVPQWTRDLWPVYGPAPEGSPPFGTEQADTFGHGCLARLNGVENLSVKATACVPGLLVGSLRGLLAPDGRHLVEGVGDRMDLFDLATVTTTKTALRTCPGDWARAWEDSNTVLIENTSTNVVTRCYVNGDAPATVPGLALAVRGSGQGVTLVPRIG